jgi:hypothetical protein
MQICNVIGFKFKASTMSIIQYCFFYNNIVEGRIEKMSTKGGQTRLDLAVLCSAIFRNS